MPWCGRQDEGQKLEPPQTLKTRKCTCTAALPQWKCLGDWSTAMLTYVWFIHMYSSTFHAIIMRVEIGLAVVVPVSGKLVGARANMDRGMVSSALTDD